jgi:hypothetical protein
MSNISAALLYSAMTFFKNSGYHFITVPMLVDEDVIRLTLPHDRQPKFHNNKCYVGSAEQSIYQLIKEGKDLPPKALAITPCQRDEMVLDELHQEIFLKIELACTDNTITYRDIANDVMNFYSQFTDKAKIVDFDNSCDIEIGGIEVGSYGQREYKGRIIHFGTCLALPRFAQALNMIMFNVNE